MAVVAQMTDQPFWTTCLTDFELARVPKHLYVVVSIACYTLFESVNLVSKMPGD
jgi:hypothetical protein